MAEILTDFEFSNRKRAKYPWPEWFDGQVRKLKRGEDFLLEPENFRVVVYETAKRKGMRVQTRIVPDEEALIIQAKPREED